MAVGSGSGLKKTSAEHSARQLARSSRHSASERKRAGSLETSLNVPLDVMAAIEFTTVEVWTKGDLTTFYLLFVRELKTRRVKLAGCTNNLFPIHFSMSLK